MNLKSLFRPWIVCDLRDNQTITVSACNAEFALLEAGRQVYTAAESNELPILWEGKFARLGFLMTHFEGKECR